jgi:hypothetical protein
VGVRGGGGGQIGLGSHVWARIGLQVILGGLKEQLTESSDSPNLTSGGF